MDDRIRREGSQNSESVNSDSPRETETNSGVNINSNAPSEKIAPTAHKVKRFEVHIPDSVDFPEGKRVAVTPPAGTPVPPAYPSKPAESQQAAAKPATNSIPDAPAKKAPAGRSAQPSGKQPQRRPAQPPLSPAAEKLRQERLAIAEKKRMNKKRRANAAYTFAKCILITCMCVIFVGTIVSVVSSVAFSFINDILVIDDENKNYSVVVEVPEGATYDTIFEILKDKGLVTQPLLTDFFCRFRHYDYEAAYDEETGELLYDEATGEVKQVPVEYLPGVYYVYADSGIENILDSMLAYNNVAKDTVRLTFPEGFTVAEVFEKIERYEVCTAEKLYANLEIVAGQYGFIKDIADTEGRYLKAEGYLFPDTYDFYIGESASSVIEKLLNNFEAKWDSAYDAQLKKLGMTKNQVMTIASIIQCEAKDGTQMADISAVIHNRLKDPASYPTLDMDSTTDYINSLKTFNILSEVHYTLYLDSYNTYSKQGLPPGPICNPGATAIKAALYPSDNDYYFFCHSESGEVYFASTAAEHQDNVQKVVYGTAGVINNE